MGEDFHILGRVLVTLVSGALLTFGLTPRPEDAVGREYCKITCEELKAKPVRVDNTYYCLCDNGTSFKRTKKFYVK